MRQVLSFRKEHLEGFKPNRFTDMSDGNLAFDKETYLNYSLFDDSTLKTIISFRHKGNDEWLCYCFISEEMDFCDTLYLRKFLWHCIETLRPKNKAARLYTISEDNDMINKWHKFLRFRKSHQTEPGWNLWDIAFDDKGRRSVWDGQQPQLSQ